MASGKAWAAERRESERRRVFEGARVGWGGAGQGREGKRRGHRPTPGDPVIPLTELVTGPIGKSNRDHLLRVTLA